MLNVSAVNLCRFLQEKTCFLNKTLGSRLKKTSEGVSVEFGRCPRCSDAAGIFRLLNVVIFYWSSRFGLKPLTVLRCLQIMTLDDGLWASLRSNSSASPPAPPPATPSSDQVGALSPSLVTHFYFVHVFCFLICCDETVLTHSLPAAGEVLSWKFALLCQLSSKMSLCAQKNLRSYDCIFKYKHTAKNVPVSLSDGGERGKETPSYTIQRSQRWVCPLPVISPSHFLKDPNH